MISSMHCFQAINREECMMLFSPQIGTDRLELERLCHENIDSRTLYAIETDEKRTVGVYEHIPQSPYSTLKDAQDALDRLETRWEDGEGAQYIVRLESSSDETGEVIGIADLYCEWERRTGYLGFIFYRPFWGRGYAGECAEALLPLAFGRLDLELIALHHQDGNDRSRRAVERIVDRFGGQHDCLLRNWTPIDDYIADEQRYTISCDQYQEATDE
ncbi:GNAT family N-acetyltransferase [Saliphagus infecundisoli]|uniref:GNAT family N-acetyltransferase n=1 Tax=Saliphagus infecundisoli TaxID=1849069 RepID=A0ABD5QCB2_9EURY|nr:GNAT family N-acetyltransferase [Saliphagus infecundisoli]